MKKLIVINLLAGPGVGKSTFAARLFVALKEYHLNVELVREYPKDLTWEGRQQALMNQVYVFAKQHHMIWVLNDKVDIAIVEGSLINSIAYIQDNPQLKELVLSEYHKFHNLNYYLYRSVAYQNFGRNQTIEEAIQKDDEILQILDENHIEYKKINPKDREEFLFIIEDIRKILQDRINNSN
jgi:adenylate kinase family enzyme